MTCRELNAFLADYLADALAPDVRACFERHLARWRRCLEYQRGFRATVRLAREACQHPDEPVSDVPVELVRAILQIRRAIVRDRTVSIPRT